MKIIQNLEYHLVDKDNAEIEKQLKNNPLYKHTTIHLKKFNCKIQELEKLMK